MKRKFVCFLLAACLCVSFSVSSHAAGEDNSGRAETLRSLGLFLGSDNGFELDRIATRVESAVMVVRMLGREDTAKSENSTHPFSDVPDWASAKVSEELLFVFEFEPNDDFEHANYMPDFAEILATSPTLWRACLCDK